MTDMGGESTINSADQSSQLADDLRHLLSRADALGMTLVSIHIENALVAMANGFDELGME